LIGLTCTPSHRNGVVTLSVLPCFISYRDAVLSLNVTTRFTPYRNGSQTLICFACSLSYSNSGGALSTLPR